MGEEVGHAEKRRAARRVVEDPCYSEHDLIRALVAEVRRLRCYPKGRTE